MPMPNRNVEGNYRYAYQGQEKDPETGMEAFELRLWDARIGRWLTVDPYGEFHSPYLGMGNSPSNTIDPDGGAIKGCNCRGGFFKRLFKGIGKFFKNNFGRFRPHKSRFSSKRYNKRWQKGSKRFPYSRPSKREFQRAITFLNPIKGDENLDLKGSLIDPIPTNPFGRDRNPSGIQIDRTYNTDIINSSLHIITDPAGVSRGRIDASVRSDDIAKEELDNIVEALRSDPCLIVRIDFTSTSAVLNPTNDLIQSANNAAQSVHLELTKYFQDKGINFDRVQRGWTRGGLAKVTVIDICD